MNPTMSIKIKAFLTVLMTAALAFGYADHFVESTYSFARLHVFLFNLCAGGMIIMYHSIGENRLTKKGYLFLGFALAFALAAFFEIYEAAVALALALAIIVETVRIKLFSLFPFGFFRKDESVARKFHQASLLCLSLGLIISAAVILNNQFFKIFDRPKLTLDVFFLGFSFPLSLITMSMIFEYARKTKDKKITRIKELIFWTINLGVITFFLFIIFESLIMQAVITFILYAAVLLMTGTHLRLGFKIQQAEFLTSGLGFLIATAVTGIVYILLEILPGYTSENYHWLLRVHTFASLYGWNLCGLAILSRKNDFPIRLNSRWLIYMHWLTVIVLAPLGHRRVGLSVITVLCYAVVLGAIFFSNRSASDVHHD